MKTKTIKLSDIVILDWEDDRKEFEFTIPIEIEKIKSFGYVGCAIANENESDACFVYVEITPSQEFEGYVNYVVVSPLFGKCESIKPIKAEYVDFAIDYELQKLNLTCANLKWKLNPNLDALVNNKNIKREQSFKKNSEYVYFLKADKFIKIGKSSGSPHSRINSLQTGCPFPIMLIAFIEGGLEKESELHKKFDQYRVHGEWFLGTGELLEFIYSLDGAIRHE